MNRRGFLQSTAATIGSVAAAPVLAKQVPDPQGTAPPTRNWEDPASAPIPILPSRSSTRAW